MNQPICFKVVLPATNAMQNTVRHGDGFVTVKPSCGTAGWGGELYVLSETIEKVAAEFPQAISIERFGVGYHLAIQLGMK